MTLILLICSLPSYAETFDLRRKDSKLVVKGTSTLRDWSMQNNNLKGKGEFLIKDHRLEKIHDLKLVVDAENFKSAYESMDEKTATTLKASKHPYINFSLLSVETLKENTSTITGALKVAGKSQKIRVSGSVENISSQGLTIEGQHKLSMDNFGVSPPSMMFSLITTGDEITIFYKLHFQKHKTEDVQ